MLFEQMAYRLIFLVFLIAGCEPQRSVLDDRPEMRFNGAEQLLQMAEDMGAKWNPAPTQYRAQTDLNKGIMLGEDLSTEEAWALYFFEVHNVMNKERFLSVYRQGRAGRMSREEWIRENAWIEYCSLQEFDSYAEKKLIPFFVEYKLSIDPIKRLQAQAKTPFEEIMQRSEESWPRNYWGGYYDTYLSALD
jgi:hypothetical protein